MSDPVTNIGIEDVLSSIRRLVADGDRVDPVLASLTRPPVPEAAVGVVTAPERLVLTPALRVISPDHPAAANAPATPDAAPGRMLPDQSPRAANISAMPLAQPVNGVGQIPAESRSALEQRIAELEAAVTLQTDEWEPDGSEEVPVVDWSTAGTTRMATTFAPDGFVFASRASASRGTGDVLDLGKAATRITLSEVPADPAPPRDPPTLVAPKPVFAWDPDELRDHRDPEPVVTDTVEPQPDVEIEVEAQFERKAEAEAEADAGEDLDLTTEREWGRAADDGPDLTGLLDEDALRALVAQVVRQELQGDLGERITRNVRKMVRREIYRVLASQDLE